MERSEYLAEDLDGEPWEIKRRKPKNTLRTTINAIGLLSAFVLIVGIIPAIALVVFMFQGTTFEWGGVFFWVWIPSLVIYPLFEIIERRM